MHDTARLSQRYPPIALYGVLGVSTWPIGCDSLSPFSERFPLGEHAKWRRDTPPPPEKGYLSDTCAIPYEKKEKRVRYPPLRYWLESVLCDMGGGVSRTRPLCCHMWALHELHNIPNFTKAGLAIYAARGLRSGTAEMTAVVFTTAVAGNFFFFFFRNCETRKLDIFQVASAEAGCRRRAQACGTHSARVEQKAV